MPPLVQILPIIAFAVIAGAVVLLMLLGRRATSTGAESPDIVPLDELPIPVGEQRELDHDLRRAGFYRPDARAEFTQLRLMLALFVTVATGVLCMVVGPEHHYYVARIAMAGVFSALVAWSTPRVIVGVLAKRRVDRVRNSLPDGLDMIGVCMLGGMSFDDALTQVGRELKQVHPDLATELLLTRRQASLSSVELAFKQFAQRIDAPEAASLQSLVQQENRLGTGMGNALREHSDELREARRHALVSHANLVNLKLLFPVVLCLMPAAVLFLWTPSIVELATYLHQLMSDTISAMP